MAAGKWAARVPKVRILSKEKVFVVKRIDVDAEERRRQVRRSGRMLNAVAGYGPAEAGGISEACEFCQRTLTRDIEAESLFCCQTELGLRIV